MPQNLDLTLRITADDRGLHAAVNATEQDLKELRDRTQETSRATDDMSDASGRAAGSLKTLAASVFSVGAVLGTWELAKRADELNILDQRIRTATKATGDYVTVSQELYDISQRTGTALETNVEIFQGIARTAGELGASTQDVLAFTEAVNQLGIIGGAGPEAMANAMLQLTQALGGGVVHAEEFNSILENTPELANRIASGLGKTTSELRSAVNEGQILSEQVFGSILGQADEISAQFESMPRTLAQSTTALGNSMGRFIQQIDEAIGLSAKLAGVFDAIADKLDAMTDPLKNFNVELQQAQQAIIGIEQRQANYERAGGLLNKWLIGDKDEALQNLEAVRKKIEQTGAVLERFAEPSDDFDTVVAQMERYESSLSETQKTAAKLSPEVDKTTASIKRMGSAASDTRDEFDEFEKRLGQYMRDLRGVTDDQLRMIEVQEDLDRALAMGKVSAEDYAAIWAKYSDELNEASDATARQTKEFDNLDGAARASADTVDPWAEAWKRAINSIDEAFADLWRSAFDGFQNFGESLKRSFTNLLAELAHAAITRPILIQLGASGAIAPGGAGASGLSSGVSGAGGVGGFSNYGSFGSFFGGTSIGTGLANTGFSAATTLGVSPDTAANLFGATATTPNWAFGVGGIGGSLIGSAVWGSENSLGSSVGASIGTAIGSIWGPVGAVIGGILGGIIGGGINSLFGGDQTDPRMQIINTDKSGNWFEDNVYSSGPFGAIGFGGKSHGIDAEEFRPAFEAVTAVDKALANIIGDEATARINEYLDNERSLMKGQGYASDTYYDLSPEAFARGIADRYRDLFAEGGTEITDLLSEFAGNLQGSFEEMLQAIAEYGAALGTINLAIEEQGGQLFGENGPIFESLTQASEWFEQFVREGETLADTFIRLVQSVELVTKTTDAFGITFAETGDALVTTSQAVIDAFGGPENYIAATSRYYENFFTPEEQAARQYGLAMTDIQAYNEALGLGPGSNLIDTKEELRDFVSGLDLTTEAGREAYVTAMQLADAILRLNDASAVLEANLAAMAGVFTNITDTIAGTRRTIEMSGLSEADRYEFLRNEIDQKLLQLQTVTDPEQFNRLFGELNALILQAWNGLSEEQRAALKGEYLSFLDEFEAYAEGQAQALEDRLKREQEIAEGQRITVEMMAAAATTQQNAANVMAQAAQAIGAALANIPSSIVVQTTAASEVGY